MIKYVKTVDQNLDLHESVIKIPILGLYVIFMMYNKFIKKKIINIIFVLF